jgi:mycofactocin precursor
MSPDDGETKRQIARHEVLIAMTHARRRNLDQDFARAWWIEFNFFNAPRRIKFPQDCCLGLHCFSPHLSVIPNPAPDITQKSVSPSIGALSRHRPSPTGHVEYAQGMQTQPAPSNGSIPQSPQGSTTTEASTAVILEEELLIEEISIDGMCGVY